MKTITQRVYKDVAANDPSELVDKIEEAVNALETQPDVNLVKIISVSHAVTVTTLGSFLWTAFITCYVDRIIKEEHVDNS